MSTIPDPADGAADGVIDGTEGGKDLDDGNVPGTENDERLDELEEQQDLEPTDS